MQAIRFVAGLVLVPVLFAAAAVACIGAGVLRLYGVVVGIDNAAMRDMGRALGEIVG